MNQVSQMGVVMANFGNLLTSMAQVVEEEMMTAIRDEQLSAEDSVKVVTDQANEQITHANDTIQGLQTNLLRSNQQLKVAADKLAELEKDLQPLARIDADEVFDALEELDLVVGKPTEARALIQKICRALAPLHERCSPEIPPKKAPNLADVAEAVVNAAPAPADVANVKDAAKA